MLDLASTCKHVAFIAAIAVMQHPGDSEAAASHLARLSPEIIGAHELDSLNIAAQAIREAAAAQEAA
jgi:hypothetical protein